MGVCVRVSGRCLLSFPFFLESVFFEVVYRTLLFLLLFMFCQAVYLALPFFSVLFINVKKRNSTLEILATTLTKVLLRPTFTDFFNSILIDARLNVITTTYSLQNNENFKIVSV